VWDEDALFQPAAEYGGMSCSGKDCRSHALAVSAWINARRLGGRIWDTALSCARKPSNSSLKIYASPAAFAGALRQRST